MANKLMNNMFAKAIGHHTRIQRSNFMQIVTCPESQEHIYFHLKLEQNRAAHCYHSPANKPDRLTDGMIFQNVPKLSSKPQTNRQINKMTNH